MRESIEEMDNLRQDLLALLEGQVDAIAREWVESGILAGGRTDQSESAVAEAERFLRVLAVGVRAQVAIPPSATGTEATLRADFPRCARLVSMLTLAEILARRIGPSASGLFAELHRAVAAMPVTGNAERLFNERLGRLNQLSWKLNLQRDEDEIIALTLTEAPLLVNAESSAVWLWDADQQVPVLMMVPGEAREIQVAPSLLQLLRQTSASGCAFSIDAGESDAYWPAELRHRPIAFIPMSGQEGCLGIITVHHVEKGSFSNDDILLLSSLGNLAATALRNVQLHANEQHLVKLLQNSIRQVGEATADQSLQSDEFIQSLIHVAEGLTRAEAVCAVVRVEKDGPPVSALSGPLAGTWAEELRAVADNILLHVGEGVMPRQGLFGVLSPITPAVLASHSVIWTTVMLDGVTAGVVAAVSAVPFGDDQAAFLETITGQIAVGIGNRLRAADMQRLLVELSNVNYVSEAITSTFDSRRILSIISQAASQAMRAPIVLCGWLDEDGTVRVLPETTVGIPPDIAEQLSLTYNNSVVRAVLDRQKEVTSRMPGQRGMAAFPRLKRLQIQDWVCVPMMVKPRARGMLLVADTRLREFTSREIAVLSTYANQAALAMENSLLYEQVDHQLQQMEQLYQMTHSIGSTLDLDAVLQNVMQAATTALASPVALVSLMEDDADVQRVVAAIGIDSAQIVSARIEAGEGILGTVQQRGEAIASSNLLRDGRSPLLHELARVEGLASSLTVPLQVRGHVLGTLTVISRETREFTPANEQLLLALATEAAVAMQNARLYEQERKHAVELHRVICHSSEQMTATLNLVSEMLQAVQSTEPSAQGIERVRLLLEAVVAAQQGMCDEDPAMVDVQQAATWLAAQRRARYARDGQSLDLKVTGAHLQLPRHEAAVLMVLVHEWMQEAIERVRHTPQQQVAIAFQQFGREVMVNVDDPVIDGERHPSENSAIMALVKRYLPGTVTESCEGDVHRIRFRFSRPA